MSTPLEDTKMALQEVRRQGIHPFCITVDRDADDYRQADVWGRALSGDRSGGGVTGEAAKHLSTADGLIRC